MPGNLAPGTYYIGGIADYNNAVAESNQIGHNHDVTQITVTAPGSVSPAAALTNAASTSAFDMLIGGARNDTFVFAVNSGNDTITTNSRGSDPMQFDHVAAIARDSVHFTTADANALVPYEAAADMLQHHFNDFLIV